MKAHASAKKKRTEREEWHTQGFNLEHSGYNHGFQPIEQLQCSYHLIVRESLHVEIYNFILKLIIRLDAVASSDSLLDSSDFEKFD